MGASGLNSCCSHGDHCSDWIGKHWGGFDDAEKAPSPQYYRHAQGDAESGPSGGAASPSHVPPMLPEGHGERQFFPMSPRVVLPAAEVSQERDDLRSQALQDSTRARSGDSSDVPPGSEVGDAVTLEAQKVIKQFVKTMVKGMEVNVLSLDGNTVACCVQLDKKLTMLSIQRANRSDAKKRQMPLETIVEVIVGEDVHGTPLPTNDMSVSLLINDGQCIAVVFEDIEFRDTFALCLSMFVEGRRSEVARGAGRALAAAVPAPPARRG